MTTPRATLEAILSEAKEIAASNPEVFFVVNDEGHSPEVTLDWISENAEAGDVIEALTGGSHSMPKVQGRWKVIESAPLPDDDGEDFFSEARYFAAEF